MLGAMDDRDGGRERESGKSVPSALLDDDDIVYSNYIYL